ncbi:MAG: adenylate/guanylate cyclase domain-containing protein [Burkholderiales bacterium]|nr:adenylate/guanylate cyclase domain-containing protein [Burkholderiales bacterium]
MSGDERATVAALDSARGVFRTQIEVHQGRVIDMAGDSVLAVFDTATGAVAAALAVQESLVATAAAVPEDRQMRFRIGVHLGDVMEKADGTVYGDGVNIAARLQGLAEPGGITVSDAVQGAVQGRVNATFADQGEQEVKNILQTVHAYRLVTAQHEALTSALDRSRKPSSEKPSIAVLPFANMSGDPEQEYFADGISEDIITGLSKLRWFFVIARNSSFAYKGKADDVKRVARELGVRYVLEGSVRKGGNRVRITAQLIDASTGSHLWADRYDGDLTDIFALQDEITMKVVAAIEPKLLEAEGIRSQSRSPEDLGAWDMVISANSLFWRLTKAEGDAAIAILQRAVERYPNYAPAHSMLAFDLLISGYVGWSFAEPQVRQAATLAARAAELDNSDPWAHLALGYVAYTMRRTDEAVEEFQRALELNPNFAAAHGYLGLALALDGRSDQAILHVEQAIRMSPHDPQNAIFNVGLAVAHYLAGRYSEAIGFGRRALQQRDGMTGGHRIYCASLAQAGQIDEARAALKRLKELQPDISIAWCEKYVPYTPGPMPRFLEGMRKAGLQ